MDFSFIADWLNSFETGTIALVIGSCAWLCALVCTLLPAPDDDSNTAYKILYNVLNWIGCNVGNAKNAMTSSSSTSTESTEDS